MDSVTLNWYRSYFSLCTFVIVCLDCLDCLDCVVVWACSCAQANQLSNVVWCVDVLANHCCCHAVYIDVHSQYSVLYVAAAKDFRYAVIVLEPGAL